MGIIQAIKNKIKEKDRKNIVFIHPIVSNDEIAKYISGFSNGNGGIILFGIKDDGKNLWIKQSAFKIQEKEVVIRKLVDTDVKLTFGDFYEGEAHKLEYIYVEKSEETVYVNGDAYKIHPLSNKPQLIISKRVFLSYCQKDSCIADLVEERIKNKVRSVQISRDIRDVKYKESFSKFMNSIGDHDFVITIISDQYLKSRNCMYEIVETMRDRNFLDKLFYVVIFEDDVKYYNDPTSTQIAADIYCLSGQENYLKYWQSEENELMKSISELADPLLISNHVEELRIITKIKLEILEFMNILRDRKGVSFGDMLDSDFEDIVSHIKSQ
ncbi:TIR domain-containing protein [Shouchella clausii]|uniref:TIR domain-containing protein n=1 Tax=Shouchella clausii TaxID=79880 RepID=UPI0007C544A2|nr:TIR domain-containing protein [Shouchella clausii]